MATARLSLPRDLRVCRRRVATVGWEPRHALADDDPRHEPPVPLCGSIHNTPPGDDDIQDSLEASIADSTPKTLTAALIVVVVVRS